MTHGMEAERKRLRWIHLIEAMVSAAANLLTYGIFFFMNHRFGWGLGRNFTLAAGQGVFYIAGALVAHPLTHKFGRRIPLAVAYLVIAASTTLAALANTPLVATIVILLFAFASAITWPIIENLVSTGDIDPHELSRRLSVYNIVWATTGAIAIALDGLIIEKFAAGVFLIPSIACVAAMFIVVFGPIEPATADAASSAPPPPAAEPGLERQRIVALWLSRICLPAMYLLIYSLGAMMPTLPVMQRLRPATQTAVGSIWLVVRLGAFLLMGATLFWHTRPRLLLAAAATLLVSLLFITLPDSLPLMIFGQVAFGATTGLIYMASLYFGMVLSEGSTEHGGYHEALIGLGMTLGPAVGAITQWISPSDQRAAVGAIGGLIATSILIASVASLRLRSRRG